MTVTSVDIYELPRVRAFAKSKGITLKELINQLIASARLETSINDKLSPGGSIIYTAEYNANEAQ